LITFKNNHISVGPIQPQAVGEYIKGVLINTKGFYVSEEYATIEYWKRVSRQLDLDVTLLVRVDKISKRGNIFARDSHSVEFIITSAERNISPSDILKIRPQHSQFEHANMRRADIIDVIKDGQSDNKSVDSLEDKIKDELKIDEIKNSSVDVKIKPNGTYEGSIDSTVTPEELLTERLEPKDTSEQPSTEDLEASDTSEQSPPENLDLLREQAEKDSVREVRKPTASKTETTQQYRRSQAVRDYVMARANGVCEGCEADAPFTSKTGDPYLHAHHIYELSDGGSDTPETVIALCPNCHYRVHHGKDGNEYNKKLERKLSKIEE
jgi:5-methylcytosine-specific restriction endonuclease McrA